MKHDKKVLVLSILTAAAMTVTSPLQVMAENPEFAHDEATWARLRDNVMEEYGTELQDAGGGIQSSLLHE